MENSFEQSLKDLEQIVTELEKGDLSLDASIEKFEKGINLSKECNKKLDEAEKKINILVNENGDIKEETFVAQE